MIESTMDYGKFVLCDYNRVAIDARHVELLKESIQENNQLDTHPIIVTEDFKVINGQHRLLAAKSLGVPIYYKVIATPNAKDIALENMAKGWGPNDYFNLYLKHGYPEYVKLNEFMKKTGLNLKFAYSILENSSGVGPSWRRLKSGEYVFKESATEEHVLIASDSVKLIKQYIFEKTIFLDSVRVWRAIIHLAATDGFDKKRWFSNLKKLSSRVTIQPTIDAYRKMFFHIYNYKKRSSHKLVGSYE